MQWVGRNYGLVPTWLSTLLSDYICLLKRGGSPCLTSNFLLESVLMKNPCVHQLLIIKNVFLHIYMYVGAQKKLLLQCEKALITGSNFHFAWKILTYSNLEHLKCIFYSRNTCFVPVYPVYLSQLTFHYRCFSCSVWFVWLYCMIYHSLNETRHSFANIDEMCVI